MAQIVAGAAILGFAALAGHLSRPQTLDEAAGRNNLEALKRLLGKGHDPKKPNSYGDTPLHIAAQNGNVGIIKELLLFNGSLAYIKNAKQRTPLMEAVVAGHVGAVRVLIQYDKSEIKKAIAESNDHCVIAVLLNALEDHGAAMLCDAARNGQLSKLLKLLESDASPDVKDRARLTPLHHASAYGKMQCITVLIKYKADVNAKCKKGDTPLHKAVRSNHLECARALIQAGASREALNNRGQTPCQLAQSRRMYQEVKPFNMLEAIVDFFARFEI